MPTSAHSSHEGKGHVGAPLRCHRQGCGRFQKGTEREEGRASPRPRQPLTIPSSQLSQMTHSHSLNCFASALEWLKEPDCWEPLKTWPVCKPPEKQLRIEIPKVRYQFCPHETQFSSESSTHIYMEGREATRGSCKMEVFDES